MAENIACNLDVVIQGAGPAGALCATLLARLGHRVLVVNRSRKTSRIEGVGQRVVDLLNAHGMHHSANAIGARARRSASWAGDVGERNVEYVTSRADLDAGLILDARENGATYLEVDSATFVSTADGHVGHVVSTEGRTVEIGACFLVEARGRAAPRNHLAQQSGPETTALVRRINQRETSSFTAVEGFADGWAWFVATPDMSLLQIFVDSSNGLPKRQELGAFFDEQRQKLAHIEELIGMAEATGDVLARNATCRLSSEIVSERCLRVGDAAVAIDPLSGHGLFEAFGSALAASATVHTLLREPDRRDLAFQFYRERAQQGFLRNARVARAR